MKKSILFALFTAIILVALTMTITIAIYMTLNDRYKVSDDILRDAQEFVSRYRNANQEQSINTNQYMEHFYNLYVVTSGGNYGDERDNDGAGAMNTNGGADGSNVGSGNADNNDAGSNDAGGDNDEDGVDAYQMKKIEYVILEAANTPSGKNMLISIPTDTRITMSNSLYVELSALMPTMPQIVQIGYISNIVDIKMAASFIARILGDSLTISVSYYTIVPDYVFDEYFDVKDGMLALSEHARALTLLPVTKRGTLDLYKSAYEIKGFETSMPLETRNMYAEYYEGLSEGDIIMHVAEGRNMNEAFIMDGIKVRQALYQFNSGE